MIEIFVALVKLWSFVIEIFIKNDDFKKAILKNKSLIVLLTTSLLLLVLTAGNARMHHDLEIRHKQLMLSTAAIQSQYQILVAEHKAIEEELKATKAFSHDLEFTNTYLKEQLKSYTSGKVYK